MSCMNGVTKTTNTFVPVIDVASFFQRQGLVWFDKQVIGVPMSVLEKQAKTLIDKNTFVVNKEEGEKTTCSFSF